MQDPGNTPYNNVSNNLISSLINLGTTVSQTLLNKMVYSNSSISDYGTGSYFLSIISCLFMLPAEFNTDFKALKPKS